MSNPYSAPAANSDQAPSGEGSITEVMMEALRGTKGWVRLVGISLLVAAVFMVFAGLAMVVGSKFAGARAGGMPMPTAALYGMSAFYFLFAAIYVALAVYLLKYASAIGRLMDDGQAESMEDALQAQRSFWRLSGIIVLVGIVITVIGIAAAIAIPIMTMSKMGPV